MKLLMQNGSVIEGTAQEMQILVSGISNIEYNGSPAARVVCKSVCTNHHSINYIDTTGKEKSNHVHIAKYKCVHFKCTDPIPVLMVSAAKLLQPVFSPSQLYNKMIEISSQYPDSVLALSSFKSQYGVAATYLAAAAHRVEMFKKVSYGFYSLI